MKHLVHLYHTNLFVAFIFDSIALMVCATTAIFTITIITAAFTI
jgi:hypothetical protein